MKNYKPLSDIFAPDPGGWKDIAERAKESFQEHMPKEYRGDSYSKGYEKRKTEGRAAPKGVSQVSRSASPDLTLTGNMLKEITATGLPHAAKLEWTGANAQKVAGLDSRGKFPMFKGQEPASNKVIDEIVADVNRLFDKKVSAVSDVTVIKI